MGFKELLGLLAVALGFYSYIPYLAGMFRGRVTPHVFTWFIWGLITAIGYAAQLSDNAGPGSWVMVFTAAACFIITILSLKWGEKTITKSDWCSFLIALAAIPLWILTDNPLWSVVLISLIDLCGFYPTVRKSWIRPWSESIPVYLLCSVKFALSLLAMDNLTWTTGLYAASMVLVYGAFTGMLLIRRRTIPA